MICSQIKELNTETEAVQDICDLAGKLQFSSGGTGDLDRNRFADRDCGDAVDIAAAHTNIAHASESFS